MLDDERYEFYKQILKPGCKVLLYNKKGSNWNWDGKMDIYKGKVVEIKRVTPSYFNILQFTYDEGEWVFDYSDIQEIIYMPVEIGDIVTSRRSYLEYLDRIQGTAEKLSVIEHNKNSTEIIKGEDADRISLRLDFIGWIADKCPGGYIVKVIKDRTYAAETKFLLDKNAVIKLNFDKNYNKIKINEEEGKTMEFTNKVCNGMATYTVDVPITASVKTCLNSWSKHIPTISKYDIYNNKTVVVTFSDGSKTRVTCTDNDVFDLEIGIEKCILKKVCGEKFKNEIQAVKRKQERLEQAILNNKKKAEEEKKAKEAKYLKEKARKLKRRIQKQAEFEVALNLKKEEIIKKLKLTDEQKKVLNEQLSK